MAGKAPKSEPGTRSDQQDSGVTYSTAICCIDGRVQEPVTDFGRKHFKVRYVDMVTRPGVVADMSEELHSHIKISIRAHDSRGIVISAHADCAANPVSDEIQKEQCRSAAEAIREAWPQVEVVPVWVSRDSKVEKL